MTASRQLALPFTLSQIYDAGDFLADESNATARAWLDATRLDEAWPAHRLALWGDEGCGKSHLLHVWTRNHGGVLLPGCGLRGMQPLADLLPGLLHVGGIAVDDADMAPEEPLLHLMNAAAEAGVPLLLAARDAPARWPTRLPDLASRLRAMTVAQVHPPGEAMLRVLLSRLLSARQLVVAEPVQEWLLLHLPRHPAALREAAARLDHTALAAGRPVTRALAASIVAEIAAPDGPASDGPANWQPATRFL